MTSKKTLTVMSKDLLIESRNSSKNNLKNIPYKKFLMEQVIQLAKKGKNNVSPNPMVGCIIVEGRKSEVIGTGWHKKYGGNHAEIEAIKNCQKKFGSKKASLLLKNSTFYVNLEPCSMEKNTPPCTDEIIKYNPRSVICATRDPNPRINGKGIKKLRAAGINVEIGLLRSDAIDLNKVFFVNQKLSRPYITLKFAQSLDKKIGMKGKKKLLISNTLSRKDVQKIRLNHQGILIGSKTLNEDDPELTVRHKKINPNNQPIKVVLGNSIQNLPSKKIFKEFSAIIFASSKEIKIPKNLQSKSFNLIEKKKNLIKKLLKVLLSKSYCSILVEGGSGVLSSFIRNGYFDEVIVYTAPHIIGEKGVKALNKPATNIFNSSLKVKKIERFDNDIKTTYINKKPNGI